MSITDPPLGAIRKSGEIEAIAPRCALVVDDDEAVRVVFRRWLSRRGWDVVEATNGLDARRLLEVPDAARQYQLVICDLRMPGISGSELYWWMAECRPAMIDRLVISSGDLVAPATVEFLRHVRCATLDKPFELAVLREIVDRVSARVRAA